MKSISIFYRVFISATIGTVICLAIGAYATDKTKTADPQIFSKIEEKYNIRISGLSSDGSMTGVGVLSADKNGSWGFSMPISKFDISTVSGDYKIRRGSGKEVVIRAKGQTGLNMEALIEVREVDGQIEIKDTKDVKDLDVSIEIPESFDVKEFEISVVNGDVTLEKVAFEKFSFKVVSGDLTAKDVSIKNIDGKMISGDVKIESLITPIVSIKATSGDIDLKIPKDPKVGFSLKSMSGDIKNSHASDDSATNRISINTMSGDIEIE